MRFLKSLHALEPVDTCASPACDFENTHISYKLKLATAPAVSKDYSSSVRQIGHRQLSEVAAKNAVVGKLNR